MKITICGSISNAGKINGIRLKLEEMGHQVYSHDLMKRYDTDPELMKKIEADHSAVKMENDTFKWYYNAIKDSDAIVVCNYEKNGIAGYIGGSVLMEIGYAHVLDKKIYFLNQIPDVGYKDELIAARPIIIDEDLNKINS